MRNIHKLTVNRPQPAGHSIDWYPREHRQSSANQNALQKLTSQKTDHFEIYKIPSRQPRPSAASSFAAAGRVNPTHRRIPEFLAKVAFFLANHSPCKNTKASNTRPRRHATDATSDPGL
jgi:hypothetical protein